MKWFETSVQDKENIHQLYLALAVTLAGNLILAAGKWAAAFYSGSSALHADAMNSISDVLYSITLIIGLLISVKHSNNSSSPPYLHLHLADIPIRHPDRSVIFVIFKVWRRRSYIFNIGKLIPANSAKRSPFGIVGSTFCTVHFLPPGL